MTKKIIIFFFGLMLLIPGTSMAASNSPISIDTYYLVVSPTNNGSTNLEVMAEYSNPSSQAYKGDGSGTVLKVTLPEGATGFDFLDSKTKIQKTATGFTTSAPIQANGTQVLPYSFQMSNGKSIKLTADYPMQTIQVLVPQGMGSVTFQGVDSTDSGTLQFDGQNYIGYDVEGINTGQSFTMVYDKDKQPPSTSSQTSTTSSSGSTSTSTSGTTSSSTSGTASTNSVLQMVLIAVILLVVIIAVVVGYLYFRKKANNLEARSGSDKEEEEFQNLVAKQNTILEKILELEENRDSGAMEQEEYRKKLAAYKEHLVQVKLGLQKFVD